MSYTSTMREARFRIADNQSGDIITMWHREVEVGDNGEPDIVTFEGYCADDPGTPLCKLGWTEEVSRDGRLVLRYFCTSISCDGVDGCVLQYSTDKEEWHDVTEAEPAQTLNCYFRCVCGGG